MAAKIKLQKDPNGFQESPPPGILGHYYESSDFFEYPKKPLLKTSHPKYIHKMVWPKKIPESKISNPPKSFDHARH